MAISRVGSAAYSPPAEGYTYTIPIGATFPSGAGSLLVLAVAGYITPLTLTLPAGWVTYFAANIGSQDCAIVAAKILTTTDIANGIEVSSTYATTNFGAVCSLFSGNNPRVDVASSVTGGSTDTLDIAVTPRTSSGWLVGVAFEDGVVPTWGGSVALTHREQEDTLGAANIYDSNGTVPQSTESEVLTSTSAIWGAALLAVTDAPLPGFFALF